MSEPTNPEHDPALAASEFAACRAEIARLREENEALRYRDMRWRDLWQQRNAAADDGGPGSLA